MARSDVNLLSWDEKEGGDAPRRLLTVLCRAERWLLRAVRIWALRRRVGNEPTAQLGWREDWRVAFLASLEPLAMTGSRRRVQVTDGATDDALADFNAGLGALAALTERPWRFHHPGCLGLDPDEDLLLGCLRLLQTGELAAAQARLASRCGNGQGAARAERALRYFSQCNAALGQMGLGLPLDGHTDALH